MLQCYSDAKTVKTKCMRSFFYASRIGVTRVYGGCIVLDEGHDIRKVPFSLEKGTCQYLTETFF